MRQDAHMGFWGEEARLLPSLPIHPCCLPLTQGCWRAERWLGRRRSQGAARRGGAPPGVVCRRSRCWCSPGSDPSLACCRRRRRLGSLCFPSVTEGAMGPALLLALLSGLGAAKPLSAPGSSHGGGLTHSLSGGTRRVRRELQGTPYEAMETLANEVYYPELVRLAALERAMSSPGGQQQEEHLTQALERAMASPSNQLQDDRLAQALERVVAPPSNQFHPDERLALALQRLLQDGHRRDQESVYLANLLRLWDEAKGAPLYPEYDETGLAGGSSPPRSLPNRYWVPEGGFEPQEELGGEEEPTGEMDPEMLRYLVGRILSGVGSSAPQRLPGPPRRLRRAIFDGDLPEPPNLLRVKRLGGEAAGEAQLQRVKRTDGEGAGGRRGVPGGTQRLRYISE